MIQLLKLSLIPVLLIFVSCGQDPAFLELQGQGDKANGRSTGEVSDEGQSLDAEEEGTNSRGEASDYGEDLDGDGWPDEVDGSMQGDGPVAGGPSGGGNNGNVPNPDNVDVPDASPNDMGAIRKCLALWGDKSPFGNQITNFEKVYASVTIGGSSTPINDTARSEAPKLILIVAGVSVDSNVTYNMLNPNGYYCINVGVNVDTQLTANIHCNAHVAQSNVSINVGSSGDPLASVGVNVNSNTDVNIVRPGDDQCRI